MLSSQRHLFNIPEEVVYLNTAYMSPLLNSVVEAIDRGVRSKAHPWKITIPNFYEDIDRARILFSGLTNSNPENIAPLFDTLIKEYSTIEFGAHFHTNPNDWFDKIDIAYNLGCRRFDSAIKGFGGCPMAKDDLTGNLPTEKLITYFNSKKIKLNINSLQFESSYNEAIKLFNKYK